MANLLRDDLASKFRISPNRLVFKNLVAGRLVDRFRFRPVGSAFVTRWVVDGLCFSGVRSPSPWRRVVCPAFCCICWLERGKERHLALRSDLLGHVAVSLLISTSWSRSPPYKKPMSQSQVLFFGRNSTRSQFTRCTPRKHRAARAESMHRKRARAQTHGTRRSSYTVSAPDVPFGMKARIKRHAQHACTALAKARQW